LNGHRHITVVDDDNAHANWMLAKKRNRPSDLIGIAPIYQNGANTIV
jgi:hypothetical protein